MRVSALVEHLSLKEQKLIPFYYFNLHCTLNSLVSTDGFIHNSCSSCPQGYYCQNLQQNSTSMKDLKSVQPPIPCGSPSYYCPTNSTAPYYVDDGYYSIGGFGPITRTNQIIAPKGFYAINGEVFKCPPGTFGDKSGLMNEECSGLCYGGYYCPAGSVSGDEVPCGRYQYCPEGSAFPIFVRHGFYTTISNLTYDYGKETEGLHYDDVKPLSHQMEAYECPYGHFCRNAVRFKCFSGTFGDKVRITCFEKTLSILLETFD